MFENQTIIQGQATLYLEYQKYQQESRNLTIQKYNGYKGTYAKRYKSSGAEAVLKKIVEANSETLQGAESLQGILNEIRAGNIFKYLEKNNKNSPNITVTNEELKKIKEQWEKILALFQKDGSFDAQRYSAIKTQYDNLNKYVDLLSRKISSGVKSSNLKNVLDEVRVHSSAGSTAMAVNGLLNGLLGEKLEVELTEELNKKINLDNNQIAIKTGNVKIGGKSIKTDIYTVIAGTEIVIGDTIYKFDSNGDILINGQKTQNVEISAEVEKALLKKGAIGFSVKGTNKTIVFHSGYSINDWVKKDKITGLYYDQLVHFYQYGTPTNINPGYWERLLLAADIPNIIGHSNLFIVSAKKITPTFKYLEQIGKKYQTQLHFNPALLKKGGEGRSGIIPSRKVVGGAL